MGDIYVKVVANIEKWQLWFSICYHYHFWITISMKSNSASYVSCGICFLLSIGQCSLPFIQGRPWFQLGKPSRRQLPISWLFDSCGADASAHYFLLISYAFPPITCNCNHTRRLRQGCCQTKSGNDVTQRNAIQKRVGFFHVVPLILRQNIMRDMKLCH